MKSRKLTVEQEAAQVATKYFTPKNIRCKFCNLAKGNSRAVEIAVLLRNKYYKSFQLIAKYLSDQGLNIRDENLNSHFRSGHMGHKDLHERRPGLRA